MSLQARTKALAQSLERNRSLRTRMESVLADRAGITEPLSVEASETQLVAPTRVARLIEKTAEQAVQTKRPLVSAVVDDPACNRRSRRRNTALPATMAFANMRVTVPCIVTDMSGTGAKLELPPASIKQFGDAEHLPSKLTLILKADRMQVECEVKWRRAGKIGVRFLGPPMPIDPPKR